MIRIGFKAVSKLFAPQVQRDAAVIVSDGAQPWRPSDRAV